MMAVPLLGKCDRLWPYHRAEQVMVQKRHVQSLQDEGDFCLQSHPAALLLAPSSQGSPSSPGRCALMIQLRDDAAVVAAA
eukprot:CAMPEP_0180804680 /NCGR_PEP_ID=MMETSP1038_2-20121128/61594_1 /TAXON_ID=632150 /ORGANISM="Azadinium spinosum, Strain 3D9" /LENGTH=79 /DNA_ID=CAMNT_0022845147 /DNA_START=13 /DNA_END=248 /DNA_ORIENTATION=+